MFVRQEKKLVRPSNRTPHAFILHTLQNHKFDKKIRSNLGKGLSSFILPLHGIPEFDFLFQHTKLFWTCDSNSKRQFLDMLPRMFFIVIILLEVYVHSFTTGSSCSSDQSMVFLTGSDANYNAASDFWAIYGFGFCQGENNTEFTECSSDGATYIITSYSNSGCTGTKVRTIYELPYISGGSVHECACIDSFTGYVKFTKYTDSSCTTLAVGVDYSDHIVPSGVSYISYGPSRVGDSNMCAGYTANPDGTITKTISTSSACPMSSPNPTETFSEGYCEDHGSGNYYKVSILSNPPSVAPSAASNSKKNDVTSSNIFWICIGAVAGVALTGLVLIFYRWHNAKNPDTSELVMSSVTAGNGDSVVIP